MSEQQFQVRIKPRNKKRGFKVRCIFHRGKRYLVTAGWYSPIPEWLANELAEITQSDDDEKAVFDVVTIQEAHKIEAAEVAEAKQGEAKHAVPFDASNVRGAPEPEPEPAGHAEYESDEDDRPAPAPKPEAPKAAKKTPRGRRGAKAK